MEVFGDGTACGGAFGRVVGEHAGEFRVAGGSTVEVRHAVDRDAGEQALEHGVPPLVGVQVPGRVGAEGGGDQPGVVGAQGVLDERDGVGAGDEVGQRVQDGTAFVRGALGVDPGQGVGAGPGRVQDEDARGVGVGGAAAAAGLGQPQLPHRDGAVGAGVGRRLVQGLVQPGPGGSPEFRAEGGAQVGGRDVGRVELRHGCGSLPGVSEGSPERVVREVAVAARRRNGRERSAKWGPAWECRGSSTTVRPW